ncbi:C4-dicarboxylate transporter, anaerobic [Vibrio cholerae]|nr:C4-dicarboxylate transporter, anaerobic [Vibrio cholerae]
MIWVELAIVLLFIFIGARIGGIGIGLAGGAGVIALSLILGVPTKQAFIPVDVILIIMSVITAIAAMQVAGGMDWLVQLAENFLRKHPERITFYAPIVTFLMTLMAGTGHTAFSTLPVICRSGKRSRRASFTPTLDCCCCLTNRDHRFTDFSGRRGIRGNAGTVWRRLLNTAGDLYPNHLCRLYGRCVCGQFYGQRAER